MREPPIPAAALPHSVTHQYGTTTTDNYGNPSKPSTRTISRVRVERSSKIVRDTQNNERQLAAQLFYDNWSSRPTNITFEVGDWITFGGLQYTVIMAEPIYGLQLLHHWELGLV